MTAVRALARLLPAWLWVVLAAVIVGGGGWIYHRMEVTGLEADLAGAQDDADAYQAQRNQWRATAQQRQADLEAAHQERLEAQAAVRQLQDDLATQGTKYRQLQQRIAQSPPEDDGPVAPVLEHALDGLPGISP